VRHRYKLKTTHADPSGTHPKQFSQELKECIGFIGNFHCRTSNHNANQNTDQVEISRNGENESKKLSPVSSNDGISGFCPLSTEAIKKYTEENPVRSLGVTAANAGAIQNIYGVPTGLSTWYIALGAELRTAFG
jgi:hypothetical protein